MTPRPPLLFYSHHGLGLGHLMRSWTLAMELRRHFRVVLLSGGPVPAGLTPPSGIDVVTLPALTMAVDGRLETPDPSTDIQAIQKRRRQIVLETYHLCRPSLIVVELFPFGRKQLANELLPMLDQARMAREERPFVVCSLRDILVSRGNDQMAHDERARTWAGQYFDAIVIHADPRLVRLEETFRPGSRLSIPFYYTGFVVKPLHEALTATVPEIVVSAGGGRVGGALFRSAVQAHTILWRRKGLGMRIVGGPFVPEPIWQELVEAARLHPGLRVDRTIPNLALVLQGCAVSVSQCGYNTALELVQSRVPSLVVPFAEGGEDEQMNRARRLEHLGLLRVLDPEALGAEALAAAIEDTLTFRPRPCVLRMRGAEVTSRFLRSRVRARLIPSRRSFCAGGAMTDWLDPCRGLLDSTSSPMTFFFRDDDGGWEDDRLFALIELFVARSLPVTLAVIPNAIEDAAARRLTDVMDTAPRLVEVHQHGFAHLNHEPQGRQCEFGGSRPAAAQRVDIERGRARLADLFGPSVRPMFTPPWNRCTRATGHCLVELGFSVLSRDACAQPFAIPGLAELPVRWDWFAHRHHERLSSQAAGLGLATAAAAGEPTGIMLHHARMDGTERQRLGELLDVLGHENAAVQTMWEVAASAAVQEHGTALPDGARG